MRIARHGLVVVAMTMVAAAACSSGSPQAGGSKVATLASASAGAESSPSAPQRPRERLDSTDAELAEMIKPYNKCMVQHGVNMDKSSANRSLSSKISQDTNDAANRICEPLYKPLPPWEEDPANPEAKDFARNVVKCLKEKGVKYVETGADGIVLEFGGPQNDARSISLGLQYVGACQRQVAAAK